ncbi:MAG TPA: ABC transporter permease, partial [Terriglobia bacterium]|nr:ABC transporter permease [Terriglobia bacterium]
MSRWTRFSSRRKRMMEDLDHDIRDFIERETRDNLERGMPPDEARYAALRKFGNVTRVKEDTWNVWTFGWLEQLGQDIRYGLRMLARNPGFTLVAVLTLALGIGVNTTLFTAFDAVALKPLPISEPNSVVRLVRSLASGSQGDIQYGFSYPEYMEYSAHNHAFSQLIAASWPIKVFAMLPSDVRSGSQAFGEPEGVRAQLVSGNYFADLGVSAAIGRTFLPEEDGAPGAHPVAVLSYPFWQRRFNSDPGILGQVLKLNGTPFTVVGVTRRDFIGTANPPRVPDVWTPLAMQSFLVLGEEWRHQSTNYPLQLLGRLLPAMRLKRAQAELTVLAQQFQSAQHHPEQDKILAITLQHATYFGETDDVRFQVFVGILMVLAGMVLLVACANLANMVLARCAGRQKEIGVRLAMGASRGRLVRQWLTESVLLALLGGVCGLILSLWASKILWLAIAPIIQALFDISPSAVQMSPDLRVFGYTLLLSIVTGVVFGLSPALRFSRPELAAAIKDEGTALGRRVTRSRLRSFLVASEVAASALLLVTATLLARGLLRAQTTDPGFKTRDVIGPLGLWFFDDPAKSNALARRVIERTRELRAVRSVGLVYRAPWSGTWTPPVRVEGTTARNLPWQILANYVSPGYFQTLGIPIVRGRNFDRYEGDTGAPVAIVSESAARQF